MHFFICVVCGQWERAKGPCGGSTVHTACADNSKAVAKVRLSIDASAPERFRLYRGY